MAKFIPDALMSHIRQATETVRHFDWTSLKNLKKEDVLAVAKNPRWHKPAAIIFGILVAIHVIKNDVIVPYMKAHFALGVDTIEVQPMTVH